MKYNITLLIVIFITIIFMFGCNVFLVYSQTKGWGWFMFFSFMLCMFISEKIE